MAGPGRFDRYYEPIPKGGREGQKRVFEQEVNFDSENLTLSGSVSAGSARARHINISGSGQVERDIAGETLDCTGSLRVGGDIRASRVKAAGSLETGGAIVSEYATFSGSCRAVNEIYAEKELSASGSIRARAIASSGSAVVNGMVETDTLEAADAEINGGGRIGALNCINCVINRSMKGQRLLRHLLGRKRQRLMIEKIEAERRADIDRCSVKEIHAGSIRVGRDCAVGKIRYSGSCEIEEGAVIGETPVKE